MEAESFFLGTGIVTYITMQAATYYHFMYDEMKQEIERTVMINTYHPVIPIPPEEVMERSIDYAAHKMKFRLERIVHESFFKSPLEKILHFPGTYLAYRKLKSTYK